MATKIRASNLHTDVKTMMQTMVDENAVDSADVSLLVNANIAGKSTSDISEGSNLYFTNERVDDRVSSLVVGGNNITATYNDTAGTLTIDGQPGYADSDVGTYISGNRTYGNITTTGTIDGRDVAADGTKLDNIEANATADQTAAEIKTAYENNSDTNAFTDADHSKLDGIESSATADQTASEIRTLVESATNSNVFTDADHSKLNAIAASATNYGNTDVQTYISGSRSYGNITTTGYLRGPATFTIDPAAHGDNTGTLVVAGNLQVDGTTTTINSTTLTVDDKNIVLASGSANAAAANGAGITVAGASANFTYESTNDRWTLNREVFSPLGFMVGTTGTDVGLVKNSSGVFDFQAQDAREISFSNVTNGEHVRIDASGNVGIGTNSPTQKLDITTAGTTRAFIKNTNLTSSGMYIGEDSTGQQILGLGAYPMRFGTNGTERMRINSNGNIGIASGGDVTLNSTDIALQVGSSSYSNPTIQIRSGTTGTGQLWFGDNSGSDAGRYDGFIQYNQQNRFMYFGTAQTERMRIDASGNVGIGTTNPVAQFAVGGAGRRIEIQGTDSVIRAFDRTASWASMQFEGASYTFDTSGTERMRIDASGNVGIGGTAEPSSTSYNSATLHLRQVGSSSVGSQLRFTSGNSGHNNTDGGFISYWADNNFYFNNQETGDFRFFSGGSERMRIDSSGNLLVGTTSTNQNIAGHGFQPDGFVYHTRDGGAMLRLNRLTSDGELMQIQKDGSTVGDIGSDNGRLYIQSSGGGNLAGIGFSRTAVAVEPRKNNAFSSAEVDIGSATYRFRDAYLSGGIDFGGPVNSGGATSSSNKLDDYEEGSWTPTSPTVTFTSVSGRYIKVGSAVHLHASITVPSTSSSVLFYIDNIPFSQSNQNAAAGFYVRYTSDTTYRMFYLSNGNRISVYNLGGLSTNLSSVSTKRFDFSGIYYTDS